MQVLPASAADMQAARARALIHTACPTAHHARQTQSASMVFIGVLLCREHTGPVG